MAVDIKSPQFPESIFEGTLSSWLKKEGQEIKQDEVLAEIETDKVVIEVTAPTDGIMGKIIVDEGSTIKSSEIIGNYNEQSGASNKVEVETKKTESEINTVEEPEEIIEEPKKLIEEPAPNIAPTKVESDTNTSDIGDQDLKGFRMGPAAKKLLKEKSVPIENVASSSKKGVITKKDVMEASIDSEKPTENIKKDESKAVEESKRVPMSRLRSVVAERLLESQSQTASLTTFNEVDLHEI